MLMNNKSKKDLMVGIIFVAVKEQGTIPIFGVTFRCGWMVTIHNTTGQGGYLRGYVAGVSRYPPSPDRTDHALIQ